MFGTGGNIRHRSLPSYGGDGGLGYGYSQPRSKRGGGGGGAAVWITGLLLLVVCMGLGWHLAATRAQLAELHTHADILEQHILNEKVC